MHDGDLGLAVPWGALPGLGAPYTLSEAVDLCVLADQLGYHSVWVPEAWGPDAFTMLGYLAARTQHIRLATGIVNVFSRSAGLLAQSAAGLDALSQGRAILGLGASGPRVIEDWHGIPFDRPLARTREYIEVIRLALSGQRVDHAGAIVRTQRFKLAHPAPGARVPIFVAGFGPRNLALIGEMADGWLPIFATTQTLPDQIAQVVAAAHAAGRPDDAVTVAPFVLLSVIATAGDASSLPTRQEGKALLRRHLAFYIGGMGTFYLDLVTRLGFGADATAIAAAWQASRRDDAIAAVSDGMLQAMTIYGTSAECIALLADLRHAGATLPIVSLPFGTTLAQAAASLRALRV